MTDFLQGPMIQSNAVVQTTAAGIFGNLSVTANSLPTNGLFLASSNNLAIATNSAQAVLINNVGCVAVGGSQAYSLLDVYGATTLRGTTAIQNLSGTNTSLSVVSTDNSYTSVTVQNSQSTTALTANGAQSELRTNTNTPLVFLTNSAERMRIDSGGNVGIATTGTTVPLTVAGSATAPSAVFAGGNTVVRIQSLASSSYSEPALDFGESTLVATARIASKNIANGGGALIFMTRDTSSLTSALTERMRITPTGSVGIGSTAPAATLDVAGTANFTSRLLIYTQGSSNLTSISTNASTIGTVAKNVAPSGGQGTLQIVSNDPSASQLQGYISLITDPTATNRRLSIQAIEQGTAYRNITLAETAGSVGIGTANPLRTLSLWYPTTSVEQSWTMAAGLLGKRTWNLVVDGGNGTTANNLTFRMLDESGTGVSGFGFNINGTTGTFATNANRQISAASVPAGSVIQTTWTSLGNGSYSATTATLTNTGFNVSFTPQYNNSKVLHIITIGCQFICDGQLRIYRNGSQITNSLMDSYRDVATTSYTNDMPAFTFTYLDSPATASAITYSLWACATGCGNTVFVGSSGDFYSSWTCMEIAA